MDGRVLRILTYNVHGLPWIQCPIEAILLWAHWKCDADILCLQEVFTEKLKQKILRLCPRYNLRAFFPENEPACFGRSYLRFGVPCGLCVLVKTSLKVLPGASFQPFLAKGGLDSLVNKGFLALEIEWQGIAVQIINTHLQADLTEIPCFQKSYCAVRDAQESQLFLACRGLGFPLVCGDFNKNRFLFFERFDEDHNITFLPTGAHIDHLLLLPQGRLQIKAKRVFYFNDILLSDHVPVLFEMSI